MAEIDFIKINVHAHFAKIARYLVMAGPLFAAGIMILPPEAFAEGIKAAGNTSVDHFESCRFLLSETQGSASEQNSDIKSRMSPYLARVQARITSFWTPPPVDDKPRTVIVRFRLERNGGVNNIAVEKSSGNDYVNMAATRAVQSAAPLPPFPANSTDSFLDLHLTLAIGEAENAVGSSDLSPQNAPPKASPTSERELRECESHLSFIFNAIHQVPQTEEGLKELKHITKELPSIARLGRHSHEYSNLIHTVENLHDDVKTKTEEISKKIIFETKFKQFDNLCEGKIAKGGMPPRFREEPVFSRLPETMTLGRAFCTAINGGGKAEFRILDDKIPTVSISVTTKKRRFAVILQKQMQVDLSEAWQAVEIQTPSDRRPADEFLGQTFMDRFPKLVQDEQ